MPDFPSAPQITTFPGPAENPLYQGGAWGYLSPTRPPLQKTATAVTNSTTDLCYSVYLPRTFTGNVIDAFACTSGGQLGADLETWRVFLFQNIRDTQYDGYLVFWGGGIGKNFAIRRYDNGVATNLIGVGGFYPEMLGIRITPTQVECWAKGTGGSWGLQCSYPDTTYRGTFYAGIGVEETSAIGDLAITCFGAGVVSRTQFFRWVGGQS